MLRGFQYVCNVCMYKRVSEIFRNVRGSLSRIQEGVSEGIDGIRASLKDFQGSQKDSWRFQGRFTRSQGVLGVMGIRRGLRDVSGDLKGAQREFSTSQERQEISRGF